MQETLIISTVLFKQIYFSEFLDAVTILNLNLSRSVSPALVTPSFVIINTH